MKLNLIAFALSAAILFSLTTIIYSVVASFTGFGIELEMVFESMLPGFTLTVGGAIVGAIWSFVYGFVLACIFAGLYNALNVPKK